MRVLVYQNRLLIFSQNKLMKLMTTTIALLIFFNSFMINLSFAGDEEAKSEIIELINETKKIWDTQNYSDLKTLWDTDDKN